MEKKKKIWLFGGIAGIMIFALATNFLFIYWSKPIFGDLLKEAIANSTENKYHLDFDNLSYNAFSSELSIVGLLLKADTTHIDTKSANFYELKIDRITINVGSIWNLIASRNLVIEHVLVVDPEIKLYRATGETDNTSKDLYNTYSFFSDFLYSLKIYKTQFKNLTFNAYNTSADTIPKFTLEKIDAYFDYLKINANELDNPGFSKYANDFQIVVRDFSNTLADSLYDVKFKEADFNKRNNSILLKELELIPRYGKYEFAQKVGHRIGRTELKVPELELSGVDFAKLLDHKILQTACITASGLAFRSFKDKRLEPILRKRKLINEMILDTPFEFSADTIQIKNGYIEHEEKTDNGEKTGHVTFENLFASIYRVSNRPAYIENDTMVADVKTKFMGKANLEVTFKFPLSSHSGFHTIVGKLSPMSLTDINAIFEPVARTTVESGDVDYLDFAIALDENKAEGKAHFAYHNLKVKLLKSDLEEPEFVENVASWLANVFIVKTNNPQEGELLREGNIYYERDDEKTVFSYWVQAILLGVRESVGIKAIPKRLGQKAKEEKNE